MRLKQHLLNGSRRRHHRFCPPAPRWTAIALGMVFLLAGVPDAWLNGDKPIELREWRTHFGVLSMTYQPDDRGGTITIHQRPDAPGGIYVRTPKGDVAIPADEEAIRLELL